MDPLQLLIDQEQAKLDVLKKEVAEREARIAMLEGMRAGTKLDAFLAENVAPAKQVAQQAASQPAHLISNPWVRPKPDAEQAASPDDAAGPATNRKHGEVKNAVLLAVGDGVIRRVSAIHDVLPLLDVDISAQRLRNELWRLKNAGLLESPSNGLFKITESGLAHISIMKGETPGDSAGGNQQAEGFELQPSPSDGA
jgi:hypothetical protein